MPVSYDMRSLGASLPPAAASDWPAASSATSYLPPPPASSLLPPAPPSAAAQAAAASGASGLSNATGEYNCFLNSLVQALFRLSCFQKHLLQSSLPTDNPPSGRDMSRDLAVVRSLQELFEALSRGAALRRDPSAVAAGAHAVVAPTSLRLALAALSPSGGEAGVNAMADAAEVLSSMYECFLRVSAGYRGEGAVSPIQTMFGIDVAEQVLCRACNKATHALRYTTFFHIVHRRAPLAALCVFALRDCICNSSLFARLSLDAAAPSAFLVTAPRCAPHTLPMRAPRLRSVWRAS
jgi:hypothetical protein